MKVIPLYKFIRPDGGVTVSPIKPEGEYSEMFRLVADEGMILKNGDVETTCTDVLSADGWEEVEAPKEDAEKVFE
jgi:hypothetical protein